MVGEDFKMPSFSFEKFSFLEEQNFYITFVNRKLNFLSEVYLKL